MYPTTKNIGTSEDREGNERGKNTTSHVTKKTQVSLLLLDHVKNAKSKS